ncbi:MAG: hypothetical protein H0W18_07680 [Acidobacteria bacterium]|nr:hypothetical protein [Acidobacteriota bacterium]
MFLGLLAALAVMWLDTAGGVPQADPVTALVTRLEQVVRTGDVAALRSLGREEKAVAELADWFGSGPARVVLKERDRTEIPSGGQRLLIEAFSEYGAEARLVTFSLDLHQSGDAWRIASASRIGNVGGLFRLALNNTKQYDVKDLTVRAPDLTLHMASGAAFVAETPEGPTVVILLGRGEMVFSPPDTAEKTQVRIFSGGDRLQARFEHVFIRVRPADFAVRFPAGALTPREISPAPLRRAEDVFEQNISKTLQIDLGDLSRERWSITPQPNDFIAEINTDKHGSLTYTRSTQDPEDVTLFDRVRRKNISVYASPDKLTKRGRFFSEDDLVDYDVLAYDVDVKVAPERALIEGSARIKVKIRAPGVAVLNMRLAESLAVRGVYSPDFGRLLHLRVVNQNSLIVSLPVTAVRGSELWLNIFYSGRVQSQELDREAIAVSQDPEIVGIPAEPRYLYSHRAYWYPQSPVSDYAPARLSIAVASDFEVVATGSPVGVPTPAAGVVEPGQRQKRVFTFSSERPVRYLAFVISRLRAVNTRRMDEVTMTVTANARQAGRAQSMSAGAEEIFQFYKSLVGRAPYPTFTLAVTEREAPGGHSPAYFAVVDQATFTGRITWRSDPVNFDNYPSFFMAHEVAHQWWGQAVGWKNYHEQWISEGFAQYFALLYAEKKLTGIAPDVVRQMRRTAIEQSSQGPVYLGYRLGHIKGQTPVFRSIVYNKAAMALHMLRRLIGDDAFFNGVRDFYDAWEFRKAGTGDFQAVMEKVSGRPLGRFFDAWIFGETIPRVRFGHRVEKNDAIVRFEQQGEPVDIPITVRLTYASGDIEDVVVPVVDKVTEQRIPLKRSLRSIEANADHAALAIIVK